MPLLSLNFAAEQRSLTTCNPAFGFVLFLVGALTLGIVAWDYQQQVIEKFSLQDRRDALFKRTQHQHNNAPIPAELAAQVEQANTAYSLLQTPWEEIFTALESARGNAPNSIALLSIKADTAKREVNLTGEAKDFTALSTFNSALSDNPFFQNISLSNDKLSTGSPPIVVTFDLRLTWRVNTPSR